VEGDGASLFFKFTFRLENPATERKACCFRSPYEEEEEGEVD
jgi:hypothetical protein